MRLSRCRLAPVGACPGKTPGTTYGAFVHPDQHRNLRRVRNRRVPFQHLDALKTLRRKEPLFRRIDQRISKQDTFGETGRLNYLRVRCQRVSLYLNGHDDRLLSTGGTRTGHQGDGCDQRNGARTHVSEPRRESSW